VATNTIAAPKKGMFRGWWVMFGGMVSYSAMACLNWMAAMTFPQLQAEFGWTAADLGLLLASLSWLGILWAPLAGWVCDRIGNRWTIITFSLLAGIAVFMYTTVTEIWQLFIYYPVICGFAVQAVLMIGVLSLPRKWFMKRAALASGLIGGFWGIVSSAVFPLVSSLSASVGWRQTIYMVVPIFAAVAVLSAFFLVRDTPEKLGLNVDGMTDEELQKTRAAMGGALGQESAMTRGEAIRTPQFWFLAIIFGISMADVGAIQGNTTLMAVSYGISPAAAGTAMSALMIPAIVARTGVGPLGDKFGKRRALWLSSAICAVILLGGWILVTNPISLYVFLVLLGLVVMAGMTLVPPIYGDLFGRKNLAGIMGLGSAIAIAISGLATMTVGIIRTSTGSYNPAFLFLAALFVVQIALVFLLKPTSVEIANTVKK